MQMQTFSRSARHLALVLALTGATGLALAQTQTAAPAGSKTAEALGPQVKQKDGVSYVSGGISDSGQAKAKELGKDMNLHLVFARASGGNYMADVAVTIADKSGKTVFELPSSDPLLFVKLPPGSYKVTAKADGKSQERMVEVSGKGQQMETLRW